MRHIADLLDDTRGREFRDLRDRAIIQLLLDSGGRLEEIAHLNVDAVEYRTRIIEE